MSLRHNAPCLDTYRRGDPFACGARKGAYPVENRVKVAIIAYIAFLCVLVALTARCGAPPSAYGQSSTFSSVDYVRTIDGDTVVVRLPGQPLVFGGGPKGIGVRLVGIDTAEMRGKTNCERVIAQRAKNYVSLRLRKAGRITLKDARAGKYFRLVADVRVDGISLSVELLEKGLAVPYDGGRKGHTNWCVILDQLQRGP